MTVFDYEMIENLLYWIHERQNIYLAKEAGEPRSSWTNDPILATYRFCNVYREQDAVTTWLRREWYGTAFAEHKDIWFAAVVARLFNEPTTLTALEPFILPFRATGLARAAHKRAAAGKRVFNPAYIVSTNGVSMDKVDYLVQRVLTPMWEQRRRMRPGRADGLAGYSALLQSFNGMAGFMAGQVVGDLKYTSPLIGASDWWTFAVSGPGSRRGMNRVMDYPPEKSWKEEAWSNAMIDLRRVINDRLDDSMLSLHAQDLQNCLCEFDKYRRAIEGGRPKQIYRPEGEK